MIKILVLKNGYRSVTRCGKIEKGKTYGYAGQGMMTFRFKIYLLK